jgi:hypothetical protein
MSTSDDIAGKRQRGPYRVGDVSTGSRDIDILRDPQAAAFAQALAQIKDPRQRAHIAWLVRELARCKQASGE